VTEGPSDRMTEEPKDQGIREAMSDRRDILFGRIALQKKLITPEQLREVMFTQASLDPPRSIAEILSDKGLVNNEQIKMVAQVTDRKLKAEIPAAVKLSPSGRRKIASPFGNLVLESGLATDEELERAVSEQERLKLEGKKYRLGQVLIMIGILSIAQVEELLSKQLKQILVCPECATQYNITTESPDKEYTCRNCGGILMPPEKLDSVSVQPDIDATDADDDVALPPIFEGIAEVVKRTKRRKVTDEEVELAEAAKSRLGGYEIKGEIARGGMGIIYKAYQKMLDRTVAIKMLIAGQEASERDSKRFMREAAAIAKLNHPNIIKVYEMNEERGVPYFTMEYIDGRSLADILKTSRPDVKTAVKIVRDIAEALEYAHASGLLHRDVKPGNILLENNTGRVVLMDFGLARSIVDEAKVTQIGFAVGTPAYMAPEQADPHGKLGGVDERTDQYALGVVLYEMLLGLTPFDAANPLQLLFKTLTEEPMPPRKVNPNIDEGLETIVLTTLKKQKNLRYPNMAAFRHDLENYITRKPLFAVARATTRQQRAIQVKAVPVSDDKIAKPEKEKEKEKVKPMTATQIVLYVLVVVALAAAVVFYGYRLYDIETGTDNTPAATGSPAEKPDPDENK